MQSQLSPDMRRELHQLHSALLGAGHGSKGALVAQFCSFNGLDSNTVYRWLKTECGYASGRAPRADKGRTCLPAASIDFMAAIKREGLRGNGHAIMPTGVAMNIADTNGVTVNVSASRVNTLLRQQGLAAKSLAAPRNTVRMRSTHPNHVHQIDPSLCVLYYMHGKQAIMGAEQFNKNKPEAFAKVKLKLWRYVRYDHASGCIDAKYYEAAGENQHSLFDFMLHTWSQQPGRLNHGVPERLLWDKGSANTSAAVCNLLDALGVLHETHAAHHAWAKGGVENANRLVETHFESRLRVEPVSSVEQLNAACAAWLKAYNANAIKHVDARITRDSGQPFVRDDLWHLITPAQLRNMPSRAVCQWFFHGKEGTRQVTNLQISFRHPELEAPAIYKLHDWAQHLTKGEQVRVLPLLGKAGAVRVLIDQLGALPPLACEVLPVMAFDQNGRDAAGQVFGQGYAALPDDATVLAAKRLNQAAYGVGGLDEADALRSKNARPFAAANGGKGMVAHSHLKDAEVATRLPRATTELDTPQLAGLSSSQTERASLSLSEACRLIKAALGDAYDAGTYGYLAKRYADGRVPADAADALAANVGHGLQATGTHDGAPVLTGLTGLRSVK